LTPGWECRFNGNKIEVAIGSKQYGSYDLLVEPYCKKCAFPGVTTAECKWHSDDYGFDRIYAVGKYMSSKSGEGWDDLLSKHIRGLKKYPNYAEPLGKAVSLCVQNLFSELNGWDFLTPVPKHPNEMTNGYNQAETLASIVSNSLGWPTASALVKVRPEKMKSFASRSSRKAGVKGLYAFSNSLSLTGKRVILIDDVTTSGSTVSECAKVLMDSGAKAVNVIVAGRDVFVN
jgi:predicted amidophosphoribosyltransferase